MASMVGQRLLTFLVMIGVASASGMGIFNGIVDMVLHPKETIHAAIRSATSMATKIPDAVIVKALEGSRELMKRPHPALGIPTLDPYFLSHLDVTHNLSSISQMEGVVEDLAVRGLSAYRVRRLAVNWTQNAVNLSLLFPQIDADGYYSVNGTFAEFFPVFGEGPFRLTIRDLEVSTVVCLSFLGKHLSVNALDLDYSFNNFESNFDGLLGGREAGELANEVMNEKAPQLCRSLAPVLKHIAARQLLGGVNAHLRKVPLSRADLLSWVPGATRLWREAEGR